MIVKWWYGEGIPEEEQSMNKNLKIRKGNFGSDLVQSDGSKNGESQQK